MYIGLGAVAIGGNAAIVSGRCDEMIKGYAVVLRVWISVVCALFVASGPSHAQDTPPKLVVFAAASLKGVLEDVAEHYADSDLIISVAGSSALARQIEYGAPADVYISAHPQWVTYLEERDLIQTAQSIASNAMVVVAPIDRPLSHSWQEHIGQGRLALAHTQAVPAGVYARTALENMGLWGRAQPTVVQTDHVRAALALVERGEVDLGIVYSTDARAANVALIDEIPQEMHPIISYVAAPLRNAAHREAAQQLVAYLASDEGQAILHDHGFLPPVSDTQVME